MYRPSKLTLMHMSRSSTSTKTCVCVCVCAAEYTYLDAYVLIEYQDHYVCVAHAMQLTPKLHKLRASHSQRKAKHSECWVLGCANDTLSAGVLGCTHDTLSAGLPIIV